MFLESLPRQLLLIAKLRRQRNRPSIAKHSQRHIRSCTRIVDHSLQRGATFHRQSVQLHHNIMRPQPGLARRPIVVHHHNLGSALGHVQRGSIRIRQILELNTQIPRRTLMAWPCVWLRAHGARKSQQRSRQPRAG
jgi:hypothetical protein